MAGENSKPGDGAAPSADTEPRIVVQMVQPTIGEVNKAMSETRPGGSYLLRNPDGTRRRVDAHGRDIK